MKGNGVLNESLALYFCAIILSKKGDVKVMFPNYTQVVRVNGENGARMYGIGPNSSALLLDESDPIVWLVQSDGAGYKTVSAYKIEPYKPEPKPNVNELLERIKRLELKYESYHSESKPE